VSPFRDAAQKWGTGRFRKNPKISFVLLRVRSAASSCTARGSASGWSVLHFFSVRAHVAGGERGGGKLAQLWPHAFLRGYRAEPCSASLSFVLELHSASSLAIVDRQPGKQTRRRARRTGCCTCALSVSGRLDQEEQYG